MAKLRKPKRKTDPSTATQGQSPPKWSPQLQLEKEKDIKTFAGWVEARKKLTQDQAYAIEAYTQGLKATKWTPKLQLEKEKGIKTFAEWVEARKELTQDQAYAIEAYTQGLKATKWTPQLQLKKEKGIKTFAEWVEARKELTQDQAYAIEAYTQGLKEVQFTKEEMEDETLEEQFGDIEELEEEDGERLTPEREFEELEAMIRLAEEEESERLTAERLAEEQREMEKAYPPLKPPKPELIIDRIPYPKWWRDSLNAKIEFQAPGSQVLATVSGKLKLFVSAIVITVTNEVWITIRFGTAGESGTIYLGGTDQPKGMVIAMGNSPAPCGKGPLSISAIDPSSLTPWVGGFATCFAMPEKE